MKTRGLALWLVVVSIGLIVVSGWWLFAPSDYGIISVEANSWEALSGVGTVSATAVAVWLAARSLRHERGGVARLVSAWVTVVFQVNEDRRTYRRVTTLYVGNESYEPVFEALVNVVLGSERISIGNLSAPSPIAVLPARSVREFDVSSAMAAQSDVDDPRAELSFTAPNGTKWLRTADGKLRDTSRQKTQWKPMPAANALQVGRNDSTNPLIVAIAFLNAVWQAADADGQERPDLNDGEPVQDPGAVASTVVSSFAPGWAGADWAQVGRELHSLAPTNYVDYRAEHVAYVKLVGDQSLQGFSVEGPDPIWIRDVSYVTLVLESPGGWRVFGVGTRVEPETILFPEGMLDSSVISRGGFTS